jgi:hypothetical protein
MIPELLHNHEFDVAEQAALPVEGDERSVMKASPHALDAGEVAMSVKGILPQLVIKSLAPKPQLKFQVGQTKSRKSLQRPSTMSRPGNKRSSQDPGLRAASS